MSCISKEDVVINVRYYEVKRTLISKHKCRRFVGNDDYERANVLIYWRKRTATLMINNRSMCYYNRFQVLINRVMGETAGICVDTLRRH